MAQGVAGAPGYGQGDTLDVAKFLHGLSFTRFHIQLLLICSLVTFFDGLDFSLIAYTLPYLREGMDLSDAMTGYVSSAAFLGQMIGSLVGSYIADLYGRRPVIIWCTILSAALKPSMMIVTASAFLPAGIDSMLIDHAGASRPPIARPPMRRRTISISGVLAKPVTKVSAALRIVHQMMTGRRP